MLSSSFHCAGDVAWLSCHLALPWTPCCPLFGGKADRLSDPAHTGFDPPSRWRSAREDPTGSQERLSLLALVWPQLPGFPGREVFSPSFSEDSLQALHHAFPS